jgi:hypothetical protein
MATALASSPARSGISRPGPEPGEGSPPSTALLTRQRPAMTTPRLSLRVALHRSLRRSARTGRLLQLLSGSSLALLCSSLLMPTSARAAAEYCHINTLGNYVCIERVFGNRSNRRILYSVNGVIYAARINCYGYNYDSTSVFSVACWNYDA